MQTYIRYVVAFSVTCSIAQVQADDVAPPRLPSNPLPVEVSDDFDDDSFETDIMEFDPTRDSLGFSRSTDAEDEPEEEESIEEEQETDAEAKPPANAIPTLPAEPETEVVEKSPQTAATTAPIEIVQERYDSGKVKIRREMTLDAEGNYIKHGHWTMMSEAGEEIANGKYVANQRQGIWRKTIGWNESPLLNTLPYPDFEAPFVSEAEFSKGKLDGTWSITDKQGRVASEWTYNNGKLVGKAKWYHPDGTIREEINYVDGMIDGTWRVVDADGTELQRYTYQQGRKLAPKQEAYGSGALQWEGIFLHETFVPNTQDDWWKTRPLTYKLVGEPERHGPFTSWYENGHKKFAGNFKQEVRTGDFTWWHENTQVSVNGKFVDGERDGLWVWWHENGQKAIQGNYSNGKLNGPWSYWNAEGKLERKVDYTGQAASVAVHSIPSTDIQIARPRVQKSTEVAKATVVGTGVRVAKKRPTSVRRRNPIRK